MPTVAELDLHHPESASCTETILALQMLNGRLSQIDTAAISSEEGGSNLFCNAQVRPANWTLPPSTTANPSTDSYPITGLPIESTINLPPTGSAQAL